MTKRDQDYSGWTKTHCEECNSIDDVCGFCLRCAKCEGVCEFRLDPDWVPPLRDANND